jgi:apolipoprotein N-acyltransferase
VAAVVANGSPPDGAPADGLWPLQSSEYRDVDATVARYENHVVRAAREGAELIVLPEVAVFAEGDGVERWLAAVSRWAREFDVTIVAPYFDPKTPTNTLTVIEPSGRRWWHDKQHPAPGLEPAPRQRQAPGPYQLERGWAISTAICVDLDYADLVAPVRAAGGVLVVPANDWKGFEEIHDQSAVWAAVLSETTVLRATGHGICSVRDGAGNLLARASSLDGPTVLVVDAPVRSAAK